MLSSLDLPSALKDLMIFFRTDSNNSHNPAPLQIFLTKKKKKKSSALQSEFHWKPKVLVKKKNKKSFSVPDGLEEF